WILLNWYERVQIERAHRDLVAALDPGQPGHAAVECLRERSVVGLNRPDDQWVGKSVPGAAARHTPAGVVRVGCGCPLGSPAACPDCRQSICHRVVGWGNKVPVADVIRISWAVCDRLYTSPGLPTIERGQRIEAGARVGCPGEDHTCLDASIWKYVRE